MAASDDKTPKLTTVDVVEFKPTVSTRGHFQNAIALCAAAINDNQKLVIDRNLGIIVASNVELPRFSDGAVQTSSVESVYLRIFHESQITSQICTVKFIPEIEESENNKADPCTTSRLIEEHHFSPALVDTLASALADNSHAATFRKYDMSAVWTIGHLIEAQLSDYELWNHSVKFGDVPTGAVVDVNVSADGDAVEANRKIIYDAIANGTIVLAASALSAQDLQVLQLLNIGCSGIKSESVYNHILSRLATPEISFVVWHRGEDFKMPAEIGTVTASMVSRTLEKLAMILSAQQSAVRGFVRAQSIVNGKVLRKEQNGNKNWFITSGIEIDSIRMPRPRQGSNFLLELLLSENGTAAADGNIDAMSDEFMALQKLSGRRRQHVGSLIATFYTLGVSAVLHQFNLSGRELTESIESNANKLIAHLASPCTTAQMTGVIKLFDFAVQAVTQFSDIVISPHCFLGANWCSSSMFKINWPTSVPYLANPVSLASMRSFRCWLDIWGLSSPGQSFNLEALITQTMHNEPCIDFRNGDLAYDRMAASGTPFVYVRYGAHALNLILQQFRYAEQLHVELVTNYKTDHNTCVHKTLYLSIDKKTFCVEPGSILSFDWEKQCVLIPRIFLTTQNRKSGIYISTYVRNLMSDGKAIFAGLQRNALKERDLDFGVLFIGL